MTVVSAPASSANIGVGFDVLAIALGLRAELGGGDAPSDARSLDGRHPAVVAHRRLGGSGAVWMRSAIPVGRGLGFSGVARVGGAALAVAQRDIALGPEEREVIVDLAAELEGHGDNVAASVFGGVVAWCGGRPAEPNGDAGARRDRSETVVLRVGPRLGGGRVITWIPDATMSTDRSRAVLSDVVSRDAAVHNLGRQARLVAAIERDDPELLRGATDDRLHQPERLPTIPGAADALYAGVEAGAWCGWLSGSGPSVALWCAAGEAERIAAALPSSGHTKQLTIDRRGVAVEPTAGAQAAWSTG